MNIEIIVYLAALAVVYFFTNYRNSFAYIWLAIYVLLAWPIEESYSGNLALAYALLGVGLISAFECLYRINRDPFSARNILDGKPISLKAKQSAKPLAILKGATDAESSALKAGFRQVNLYVDASNLSRSRLIDFAKTGPLNNIGRQGVIKDIHVFTKDGVFVIPGL